MCLLVGYNVFKKKKDKVNNKYSIMPGSHKDLWERVRHGVLCGLYGHSILFSLLHSISMPVSDGGVL